jgi:hypothetical protein
MEVDDDGYWAEVTRRTGSNSAAEGFELLKSFVESGTATDKALYGMFSVLRSLSQNCQDQINARRAVTRSRINA